MSLGEGFDPLDEELRERYLGCFTPDYWDDDVVHGSDNYISRAKSTMGRRGRRHAQEVIDRYGPDLIPQRPMAVRDGVFDPDDMQLPPGSIVKVISETAYGRPEPEVFEYLAEGAPGAQRIQTQAFDICFEGPSGERYLYHQQADWFMAETNAGSPAGISLFPLEIDYLSSAFIGPYGDEGGTAVAITRVNENAGVPLLHLGVHPSPTPEVHHRVARAVIYENLLPNYNRPFVPDVNDFL
ncbi:MAG: hypothetical protein KIH63_002340 [Candidatus Saccharibacteria bacterium]|nr:hypothetical protein [Candidatus Saccharibacteria bacterium]